MKRSFCGWHSFFARLLLSFGFATFQPQASTTLGCGLFARRFSGYRCRRGVSSGHLFDAREIEYFDDVYYLLYNHIKSHFSLPVVGEVDPRAASDGDGAVDGEDDDDDTDEVVMRLRRFLPLLAALLQRLPFDPGVVAAELESPRGDGMNDNRR
jgi:hypothetical protein